MNYFLPAAGIIPYIVLNETVFYLLGKEKSNKKWSGFIGNYDNNDLNSGMDSLQIVLYQYPINQIV